MSRQSVTMSTPLQTLRFIEIMQTMTREEVEAFLGKRVAVRLEMGAILIGYLQRPLNSTYPFETLRSASHLEVESHHEPFWPHDAIRIEEISSDRERELLAACTCGNEDLNDDWVTCPVHGPSGEDFRNHL